MRLRLVGATAAALLALAADGRTQVLSDRAAALKRPLSPGAIALLVEHASDAEVQRRLAEGLAHASPDIRAAAARVIFISGAKGLIPQLRTALSHEQQEDPALEQMRALSSLAGAADDAVIVEALGRLGPAAARAAAAYAFVRGPVALVATDAIRAADPDPRALVPFFVAMRMDPEGVTGQLRASIEKTDAGLVQACLPAAREMKVSVPVVLIVDALSTFKDAETQRETVNFLVRTWNGERADAGLAAAASGAIAALSSDSTDTEAVVIAELASRISGRAPASVPAWQAAVSTRDVSLLFPLNENRALQKLLTPSELALFTKPGKRSPPQVASPALSVQTLERFPNRFLSDLLEVVGCTPNKASRQVGLGIVTLRPDGRASRVSLLRDGLTDDNCGVAARVALVSHVTSRPSVGAQQRMVVFPMGRDFVECRESMLQHPRAARAVGRKFKEPRKTRDVRPVYPQSAVADSVEGTVILDAELAPTGCVREARILTSVDGRLDMSAIQAVIQWRFTPMELNGEPVPAIVTVTTNFALR